MDVQIEVYLLEKKETPVEKKEEPEEERKSTSVVGILEEAPEEDEEEQPIETPEKEPAKKEVTTRVQSTPHTRKIAKDLGVDIETVKGSGPEGRVTDADVQKVSGTTVTKISTAAPLAGERIPLKGIRKIIAQRMIESKQKAAHVTHMDEADITALYAIKKKYAAAAEEKGVKLTLLAFIIKAMAAIMKEYPSMNASIDETAQEIVLKKEYHCGLAVDTEGGLLVPVIRDVDKKSVLDIAAAIIDLATRARERKVKPEELQGSTFTITNIGSLGGIQATPIINYPECCILGVMRIQDRMRMYKGEMVPRRVLPLNLTFDHRIADGAQAARFMNDLVKHLSDPELMLVDVI